MNREAAQRRFDALREVREDRGATPAEAKTAASMAARLQAQFKLEEPAARARRQPPPAARRRGRSPAGPMGFVFVDPMPAWRFDPSTGAHSDNVDVKWHRGRGNWKIEIDLNQPVPAPRVRSPRRGRLDQ